MRFGFLGFIIAMGIHSLSHGLSCQKILSMRVESISGNIVQIFDYSFKSRIPRSGITELPDDYNPKTDVLYGLSSLKPGHTFLRAGGRELHGYMHFQKPAEIKIDHGKRVGAFVFVIIKGLSEEQVNGISEMILNMEGKKTITCVSAVCHALSHGAQIDLASGMYGRALPVQALREVFNNGISQEQKPLRVELYKSVAEPIQEILNRHQILDYKLIMVTPWTLIYGLYRKFLLRDPNVILNQ